MAWTSPRTWVTDEIPSAATFNTHVRDNLNYLKGGVDFWSCSYVVCAVADGITNGVQKLRMGPAPSFLSGFNLTKSTFTHTTAGDTRATEATVQRGRQSAPGSAHTWVDMYSTHVTIDLGEYCSLDAATPGVINGSYDDVAEGDLWRINVVAHEAGSDGLSVTLEFEKP